MPHLYCAGPLFNEPERVEMAGIAAGLEAAGHTTFLPQRDGLEFARLLPALREAGLGDADAGRALQRAIFSFDVHQLLDRCDGVVANLNGRVPDEGTVVEAALAWLAGKPLVLYKADARSMLEGSDNPMLVGLGDFTTVASLDALPAAIERALAEPTADRVSRVTAHGARIAALRAAGEGVAAVALSLARLAAAR